MDLTGWRLAPGVSPPHLTRRAVGRLPLRWPVMVPAHGLHNPPHELVLAAISRVDDRLDRSARVLGVVAGDRARAYAFERRTDRGVLDLRLEGGRVRDATGSTWQGDGRAVDGPLAGTALRPLRSVLTYWYAWAGYHPGTDIASAVLGATAR